MNPLLLIITGILLSLWGLWFIRFILNNLRQEKSLRNSIEELYALLDGKYELVHNNIGALSHVSSALQNRFSSLLKEKADLEDRFMELQAERNLLFSIKQKLSTLCAVHIPVDIGARWDALVEREWGKVNKAALDHLNSIKFMNEQNQEFITEVFKEFGDQQVIFIDFSKKYKEKMEEYSREAEDAKKHIMDELINSSTKIEEAFQQFDLIEDIAEKIKMISLNLSIEASKIRGAESFSLLARELRKLAQSTDESAKTIKEKIHITINSLKTSREDEIKNLSTIDTILQEFEGLLVNYDKATEKLNDYMQKAIERINANQKEQKEILLKFFKTLQQIAIVKEELDHQIGYYNIFLHKTNEFVQNHYRNDSTCFNTSCSQKREMLEKLAAIANTDEERRMVNELFKEMLNEDRETEHGTLVQDSNDFISFN
jgi:hypothetical protein